MCSMRAIRYVSSAGGSNHFVPQTHATSPRGCLAAVSRLSRVVSRISHTLLRLSRACLAQSRGRLAGGAPTPFRASRTELRCYIKFDVSRYISDTVIQQIHQVLQQACWHEAWTRIHQVLQQLQHVTARVTAKLMYQPKDTPEAKEVEYDPKLPFFNVVSVFRL